MYPELKGLLYHGSAMEVREVEVTLGIKYKDFGQGFYTTSNRLQAEKYAVMKARQQKKSQGVVSIFSFPGDPSLKIMRFQGADLSWLDFIIQNRGTVPEQFIPKPLYDIVIGPAADDVVGIVINNFLAGVYGAPDLQEARITAIRLIEFEKLHNQVFFGSAKATASLHFKEVYYVAAHRRLD